MPVMTTMPTPAPSASAATNPLLAQAQQIAIQQQLAGALLGKSLQDYSPTVAGPAGNPFARSTVNYGDIISQIANSLGGHALLNQIGPEQLKLAQLSHDIQAQDTSGVIQALEGGQVGVPGPDGSTPVTVAGDPLQAIKLAGQSYSPAVNALGNSLLDTYEKAKLASIVTPADAGTLLRNVTAPSFASSITPDLFGNTLDPSKLVNKATITQGPGGAMGTTLPYPGAVTQGAGVLAPPVSPVIPPGAPVPLYTKPGAVPQPGVDAALSAPASVASDANVQTTPLAPQPSITGVSLSPAASAFYKGATPLNDYDANIAALTASTKSASSAAGTNQTTAPLAIGEEGNLTALKTPLTDAQEKNTDATFDTLKAQKATSQNFANFLPQLQTALSLIPKVNFGMGGQIVQDAQRALIALGAPPSEAAKLTDSVGATQVYLKTLMNTAIPLTHEINSRAASQMLNQVLTAVAASPEVSPQAAKTIVTNIILNGFNDYTKLKEGISQAAQLPQVGGTQASNYDVPNFPSFYDTLKTMQNEGGKFQIGYNATSRTLRNLEDLGHVDVGGPAVPTYTPEQQAIRANLGLH